MSSPTTQDAPDPISVHTVLQSARGLILDPNNWTQNTYARRRSDLEPLFDCQTAPGQDVCRCAVGAVRGVPGASEELQGRAQNLLNAAASDLFDMNVIQVNDRIYHANWDSDSLRIILDPRAHALVMRVYDRALDLAAGLELAGVPA